MSVGFKGRFSASTLDVNFASTCDLNSYRHLPDDHQTGQDSPFSLCLVSERRGNNFKGFKDVYLEEKGQNLALTALHVPCSFDSGKPTWGYHVDVQKRANEGSRSGFSVNFRPQLCVAQAPAGRPPDSARPPHLAPQSPHRYPPPPCFGLDLNPESSRLP